jgi:hypothetical protein
MEPLLTSRIRLRVTRLLQLGVKAVESAAQAAVLPSDPKATLGRLLGKLRASRDNCSLVIGDPDGSREVRPLIECMRLLSEGQTSRHGSRSPGAS